MNSAMRTVDPLRRLADSLSRPIDWAGRLAAACGLMLVFVVAGNVLARYVLNLGSVAAQELEWHLVSPIALLGMSYALHRGEHVRVDFLYNLMGERGRQVVDLLTAFLILAFSVAVVMLSLPYVQHSYGLAEGSPDPGGIPYRWILKSFIPLGFGLLALQSLARVLTGVADLAAPLADAPSLPEADHQEDQRAATTTAA